MPLTATKHGDSVVRAFVWGLLPDNNEVLRRWGQDFHVSPRNPFRLLAHVGEDCAGAVQFVRPDRASKWLGGDPLEGIDWLDEDGLASRIKDLAADHGAARRRGDEGQFSLAGAQPKTALFRDPESGRWGIPYGTTPTTHILKPATGEFDAYHQNEHFCLLLASRLGLPTPKSWIEVIDEIQVIIIERFDRAKIAGEMPIRIHQEDACQAAGKPPTKKYQNEGGPTAKEIFELIREHSSNRKTDVLRFLDALIFNWLIGGTDAHSKNYGFLIAGREQIRLAPLYDISSCLPYPRRVPIRKAKLAMKIGGKYLLSRIGPHSWKKAAKEWKLDQQEVLGRIMNQANRIQDAAPAVAELMADGITESSDMSDRLVQGISARAKDCLQQV